MKEGTGFIIFFFFYRNFKMPKQPTWYTTSYQKPKSWTHFKNMMWSSLGLEHRCLTSASLQSVSPATTHVYRETYIIAIRIPFITWIVKCVRRFNDWGFALVVSLICPVIVKFIKVNVAINPSFDIVMKEEDMVVMQCMKKIDQQNLAWSPS